MVERIALRESIDQLPEKERMTILLRYFKGLTQEQTARILGVSQVQVSRLERRGLKRLRESLSTLKIVLSLELRHGVPVPLGHVGHAAAGVVPLPDGDGVVEPLPQQAVAGLRLVRRRHLEVLQGPDGGPAPGVEQRLPVGAVVEEEPLVPVAGAEVLPQQGKDPVFRLDLAAQHARPGRRSGQSPCTGGPRRSGGAPPGGWGTGSRRTGPGGTGAPPPAASPPDGTGAAPGPAGR